MKLEPMDKPEGYEGAYRFFRNVDTGRAWKVKLDLRPFRPAMVEAPVDLAPGEYAVTVTVSPPDDAGKTILEDGKPLVIDSLTHTFTAVEMGAPDFDPDARVMSIVEDRVALGEARLAAADRLQSMASGWA